MSARLTNQLEQVVSILAEAQPDGMSGAKVAAAFNSRNEDGPTVTERTVRRWLALLEDQGRVASEGSVRWRRYRVVAESPVPNESTSADGAALSDAAARSQASAVRIGSSPYSTGGGGVLLEQQFAAVALGGLLLAQPIDGLGDEFIPIKVGLQQEVYSVVDDVVVTGRSNSTERQLRVACRRKPVLSKTNEKTVKLFTDFVRVVLDEGAAIQSGVLRLGLAVEGSLTAVAELAVLTDIARRQPDRLSFDTAVSAPGAHGTRVRDRLGNADDLVKAALEAIKSAADVKDVSWQLLRGLYVLQVRLEGDVAPDRTSLVSRLQSLTVDASRAEELRLRLVGIAGQGAIRSGQFTRAMLRRELRPFGKLGASSDFATVRPQVEMLENLLRQRTHQTLSRKPGDSPFTLDRSKLRDSLIKRVSTAQGQVVVVRGEPDVGKSALAVSAADELRGAGGAVLLMSLRDLPTMAVDLRTTLGMPVDDLFGSAPSGSINALFVDGAELIQERESTSLVPLIASATAAGYATLLVVRDDAAGIVRQTLKNVEGTGNEPFVVPALDDREIQTLADGIAELRRLAAEPRAAWLMRRLGLVELLLGSAGEEMALPEKLASEADIFAVVWARLVRRSERLIGGVSPDDREAAVVEMARDVLSGNAFDTGRWGATLPSLRSDGIVERPRNAAWHAREAFASDVLRDFATARLLVRDGLRVLEESAAPRWAIRATRLYAQALLSDAAQHVPGSLANRYKELRGDFAELAKNHGARWSELLWEALLSAGWADRVFDELTATLKDNPAWLLEAMGCLERRFTHAGACDPLIGSPLVAWLAKNGRLPHASYYDDERSPLRVVLAWLRGVSRLEVRGDDISVYRDLRVTVRDELLKGDTDNRLRGRLEALGLLGADTDGATVAALRETAAKWPHVLAPLVESLDAALALSQVDTTLLADLTEAYYIEQPSPVSWPGSVDDEGIRGHEAGGWGEPLAAWYRGPFLPLLRRDPARGLQVINRMCDRGAKRRNLTLIGLGVGESDSESDPELSIGQSIELLGESPRFYAGDGHVWLWYRGSGVGPYPCMTALFCLEILLDELVAAGWSPGAVARWVLKDATTLATPALVYGFLVRHIEAVTDELEGFLASPNVWHLEFARVINEGRLHVQGADYQRLAGRDRRTWKPQDVATYLVLTTADRGDKATLTRLEQVGRRLVDAAGRSEAPAEVRLWAAHLDFNSYEIENQGKYRAVQVRPPAEVIEALAPSQQRSADVFALYGLLNRYRPVYAAPYRMTLARGADEESLANDYATARRLEGVGSGGDDDNADLKRSALAGVAAAILDARLRRIGAPEGAAGWSVSLLCDVATAPRTLEYTSEHSVYPDGADRKAALGLPCALPILESDKLASDLLAKGLVAGMTSAVFEVRHRAAEGLNSVIDRPCAGDSERACWHELAWNAIEAGARAIAVGQRQNGRRRAISLSGDLSGALLSTSAADVMLGQLIPPTICVVAAANGNTCLAARAREIRLPMLDLCADVSALWATKNYSWPEQQQYALASSLLAWSANTGVDVLTGFARRMATSPRAVGEYLHALSIVATYEGGCAAILNKAWPELMEIGLGILRKPGAWEERYQRQVLVRNLVPKPSLTASVSDTQVLERAERNWLHVDAISSGMDEWVDLAQDEDWCIDSLVGFLRTQDLSTQAGPGLRWIRKLVVGDDGSARKSGFLLVEWLDALRNSGRVTGDALRDYRAVVDALVLSGYTGARALQQRDE